MDTKGIERLARSLMQSSEVAWVQMIHTVICSHVVQPHSCRWPIAKPVVYVLLSPGLMTGGTTAKPCVVVFGGILNKASQAALPAQR